MFCRGVTSALNALRTIFSSYEETFLNSIMVFVQNGIQSREFRIFISGALSGATSKTFTAPIETVR